jgi:hypothetical protein
MLLLKYERMKLLTFKEIDGGVKVLRWINGQRWEQEQARTVCSGSGWGKKKVQIGGEGTFSLGPSYQPGLKVKL